MSEADISKKAYELLSHLAYQSSLYYSRVSTYKATPSEMIRLDEEREKASNDLINYIAALEAERNALTMAIAKVREAHGGLHAYLDRNVPFNFQLEKAMDFIRMVDDALPEPPADGG